MWRRRWHSCAAASIDVAAALVFVGGGIPPRFADFLMQSPFRERFEAKGRFRSDLQNVPTRLILRGDIALLGLAEAWHPTA